MKLFIDSSTSYLYLSIPEKRISFTRSGKNDHSETLVDYLERFLKETSVNIEDITEVYVGRGPGSYTGLRIAGTVGKVLAYTKNLKLYSFSSLDLILANKITCDGRYLARIVAKKNHSYIKAVIVKDGIITCITEDTFIEDTKLDIYQDYQIIEPSEEIYSTYISSNNIIKYNLLKEESKYDYVPKYLRSGI